MENPTHTPGPWNCKKIKTMKIEGIEITTHEIQSKFGPLTTVIGSKSNAKLIAAAPELLEALKIAHKELMQFVTTYGNEMEWLDNDQALDIIESAIEKATK